MESGTDFTLTTALLRMRTVRMTPDEAPGPLTHTEQSILRAFVTNSIYTRVRIVQRFHSRAQQPGAGVCPCCNTGDDETLDLGTARAHKAACKDLALPPDGLGNLPKCLVLRGIAPAYSNAWWLPRKGHARGSSRTRASARQAQGFAMAPTRRTPVGR